MAPVSKAAESATAIKSDSLAQEVKAYSQENMLHNSRIVYYSKTFLSIVAGAVAGILGLTGLAGFFCYVLIMGLGSVGLYLKTGGDISSYFDSWQRVAIDGVSQGAMSFILFWTLAYDIVHIF
eukprot:TRINITY_DN14937_c0_g1_i1.p2 TRINITY_DN14937_c0_g1~~TRINITY_DN14937_c0_g1_i1.p2  ORF type:complete len:123 (-),score=18.42 TRINITY_DN14937_c0_g1_i1:725-1093(-)